MDSQNNEALETNSSEIVEEKVIVNDDVEKELNAIGEEIIQLENRLEKVDDESSLVTKQDQKYNRKQRRRMERMTKHQQKADQKKIDQKGNTFITRREFVGLFQSVQKLRDRLYYIDVLTGALEKLLLQKGILTEDELKEVIKIENEKAMKYQDIQKGEKDYKNRIRELQKLEINPNASVIPQQIFDDKDLTIDQKIDLAKEFGLEELLKILETINNKK